MGADSLTWKGGNRLSFSVKGAYFLLCSLGAHQVIWPDKQIWKVTSPCKVSCFVWLVANKACLTPENLQKKDWHLVSRCLLCNDAQENNSHLFLHCRVTDQLWQLFLTLGKVKWVMPGITLDLLRCWNNSAGSKAKWWKVMPISIWWTVWRERNVRCF